MVRFPNQLFINNEFCDASDGGVFETINPNDESVICSVPKGTKSDVDRAVGAAARAFTGEWGRMNARDRGGLMFRLADIMDKHREELATIETIDSGAVYTLALKTHIGMSIDAFRYDPSTHAILNIFLKTIFFRILFFTAFMGYLNNDVGLFF